MSRSDNCNSEISGEYGALPAIWRMSVLPALRSLLRADGKAILTPSSSRTAKRCACAEKPTPRGRLLDDPTQGRYPMQASGEKEFVRQHTRHILYPQNWGKSKVGTSVCHAWRRKAKALIGRYASIYAMPTNKSSLPPWWLPLLRLRTAHLRHGQHNISFSTCVAQRTHISALSILSTLRTGSLTFMSSVTFIPYTILSTASPRCCGCCARLWGVANDCCGRRAAAARVDAGAKVEAKPLFRITAAVVRVNRACNIPPLARQRN